MARPPDFRNKLQFRYYPAQQFISGFSSKSRPNGRFINARPNGRFNNRLAIFSKSLPNGCFINAMPNGRFINARPNGRFSEAETTDGQTSKFQQQIAISLLSRTINLTAAGPSCFQQKPAQWPLRQWQVQWPFYQRQAQWPFYQGRSNRTARPPDSAKTCNFAIIPHNQCNSGRAKLFSSKSRPNGRSINARPNGRFIKAEATGWPDLQTLKTNCNFAITPHNQFDSGRAKLFSSKSRPNGRFINARPNGRFNNGLAICSKSLPNGCFINAMPNGSFINAKPWPF